MNVTLVKVDDTKWAKCHCCEAQVRTYEPRWKLKPLKGKALGTYCERCVRDQIPQKECKLNGWIMVDQP
jgi:hypothetical protein